MAVPRPATQPTIATRTGASAHRGARPIEGPHGRQGTRQNVTVDGADERQLSAWNAATTASQFLRDQREVQARWTARAADPRGRSAVGKL